MSCKGLLEWGCLLWRPNITHTKSFVPDHGTSTGKGYVFDQVWLLFYCLFLTKGRRRTRLLLEERSCHDDMKIHKKQVTGQPFQTIQLAVILVVDVSFQVCSSLSTSKATSWGTLAANKNGLLLHGRTTIRNSLHFRIFAHLISTLLGKAALSLGVPLKCCEHNALHLHNWPNCSLLSAVSRLFAEQINSGTVTPNRPDPEETRSE